MDRDRRTPTLCPLAQQLGIATTIKRELEDLATNVLYPGLGDQRIARLALALRQSVTCDAHRPVSTMVEKLAGVLGVIGAFVMALIRWELAAWTVAALVLGCLILLGAVLFARNDAPVNRLRALVRAWRPPCPPGAPAATSVTNPARLNRKLSVSELTSGGHRYTRIRIVAGCKRII
jgi:hypothetical protein